MKYLKTKITLLSLLMVVMVTSVMGAVGDLTFANMPTGSNIAGRENITVDLEFGGNAVATFNISTCSISASSALTGDTYSATWYPQRTNPSINNSNRTEVLLNTTLLQDSTDWVFTGTCLNLTQDGVTDANRTLTITSVTVTVDNFVPTCSAGQTSNTQYAPDSTWSMTATNATLGWIQFGGNTKNTMGCGTVGETRTCTYSSDVPTNLYSFVYYVLSDGTNITTCATLTDVDVDRDGLKLTSYAAIDAAKKAAAEDVVEQQQATSSNNNQMIMIIVIAGAAFLLLKKK